MKRAVILLLICLFVFILTDKNTNERIELVCLKQKM